MTFKVWPSIENVGLSKHLDGFLIFWPKSLSLDKSLNNFVKMYKLFKFEICDNDDSFEENYIKIAIYVNNEGVTHACRQLHTKDNIWASKLGDSVVIRHRLYSLESEKYGKVACIMKRHISISPK